MSFQLTWKQNGHDISIRRRKPSLVVSVDDKRHNVALAKDRQNNDYLSFNGREVPFHAETHGDEVFVKIDGRTWSFGVVDPRRAAAGDVNADDTIPAPMPGVVVDTHCKAGQSVKSGETLIVIESMKLQSSLLSPRDGVVAAVNFEAGDTFDKGVLLVELEPVEAGDS